MIVTPERAAVTDQSLWPELLGQVRSLADPEASFSGDDVRISRRYGLYQDVQAAGYFMLRVKTAGATLVPGQLRALGALAQAYGHDLLNITTRQCVQLHWLRAADLQAVFAGIAAVGLTSRGAGGSTVLNITGCPVAGLDRQELFDCRAHWHDLATYFQEDPAYVDLPRKLKITISTCEGNCSAPAINCIAFTGTRQAGDDGVELAGFDMLVGGGLGSSPRMARSLGVFLAPHEVVDAARAAADVWRENPAFHKTKGRSRLKWMVDDLGPPGVREAMEAKLGRRLRDLVAAPPPAGQVQDHLGIHTQKDGKAYIGLPVLAGQLSGLQAVQLADLVDAAGGDVRLTRRQNLIAANIPAARVQDVVDGAAKIGFHLEERGLRGLSVACVGQPHCRFAQAASKPMLKTIIGHLEHCFGHLADTLTMSVDACPQACGLHWVVDIGLQGASVRDADGTRSEAYDIYLHGNLDGESGVGRALLKKVPSGDVPRYVEHLVAAYLAGRAGDEPFRAYTSRMSDDDLAAIARGAA